MKIVTRSAEQTIALGEKLGALLGGGEIIAYTGDLGAGKTTMTRGISIGMGLGDIRARKRVPRRGQEPLPLRYVPHNLLGGS